MPLFTAAQIAAAMGCRRQSVQRRLSRITPASTKLIDGNEARTWSVESLPRDMMDLLAKAAHKAGCRDVASFLQQAHRAWQPAVPLSRCSAAAIEKATKLRDALQPSLRRQHDAVSASEFERRGLEDYRRAFGHVITERQLRTLFRRTVQRDGGREEWQRLELYLDERPPQREPVNGKAIDPSRSEFANIHSFLSACGNPAAPNDTEREAIWTLAFEHLDRMVGEGVTAKRAKRRLREFLFAHAGFLAPTRDALLRALARRLERWQHSCGDVKALRDGREHNTGNLDGYELPEGDRDLLIHRAVFSCGGRIAQAWRGLLQEAAFSLDTQARYAGKAANKSHVPHTIAESVRAEVEILSEMLLGPRAFDLLKPSVSRHYDGIHSLQCMMADDVTLPVLFSVPDGHGSHNLVRGQCLITIDFRSLSVLGHSLQPEPNYNSLVIFSLTRRVMEQWGAPKILYWERGIWESSAILTGRKDRLSMAEVSQGLREHGIKFIHAVRPRSKPVERVIGLLQDLMEGEPGYTGREERKDLPYATKLASQAVRARREHPSRHFYNFDQWNTRLGQIIERYNQTPQQGKILSGLSPEAALEKFVNHVDPPVGLVAGARYLLAPKEEKTVTPGGRRGDRGGGITFQVGKQIFRYFGPELAHLIGQRVIAWFDPENPEIMTVTDMDRQNPICVPQHQEVSALAELTGEQNALAHELARSSGHMSHMKARFNVLKAKFPLPARLNLIAAQVIDTGRQIDEQKEVIREEKRRSTRRATEARMLGNEMGIELPASARESDTALESARGLNGFLKEDS